MQTSLDTSWIVRNRYLVLTLLGLVMYVACLGTRDLWYPDEPDIGEVTLAMFRSGDWIAPRRNGVIWIDYPPLLYWAASATSHLLGGMSEFSLRLPSALGALALVLATCAAASRWFGARTGLWAGFLLLTFSQFAYNAVSYRTDILFSVTIGAGVLTHAVGSGPGGRWWLRVVAFALFGLAVLTKGPLGLLLPGLVLTLWHGSRREWRRLFELAPLSLVALAVAAPWVVACANAMGWDDFLGEIYAQNFQRFGSGFRGHEQPIHYYLGVVWVDLAPWSLMLPFAIWWLVRTGRWRAREMQLALWWFGAFVVFLTFAATKRQVYLLPAYPAAALLLAPWFAEVFRADAATQPPPDPRPGRVFLVGIAGIFVLAGLATVLGAALLDPIVARLDLPPLREGVAFSLRIPLLATGLLTLVLGIWVAAACRARAWRKSLLRVAAAPIPLFLALNCLVLPCLEPVKSYAPASSWVRERIPEDETHIAIAFPRHLDIRKMGAFGYYTRCLTDLIYEEEELRAFLAERPGSLVLVHEEVVDTMFASDPEGWRSRVLRDDLIAARHRYLVVR